MVPDRSAARLRFARIMLRMQLTGLTAGAVVIVYVLGFGAHPHRVGYACLIAACYVACTGIVTFLTQQAWRAQARRAAASDSLHADGAVTTGNTAGAGAAGAWERLRSQRRVWLSVTLLGAAMLITFVVLLGHYEGPADALDASGVPVSGVVTSVIGQGEPPADGAVDVRYVYAGQVFDAHIYRDDNSPFYHTGEAVTVTVDPSDPQVATVGESDNERPGVVWLLVVLLVGGGAAVVVGLLALLALGLTRRAARKASARLTSVAN